MTQIVVHCVSPKGYAIDYIEMLTAEQGEQPLIDVINALDAYLETNGLHPAFAVPAPSGGNGRPSSGSGCPHHGAEKLGDYQGKAECRVTKGAKPDWPAREWTGRDGKTMYTCTWKAA